VAGPGGRPLPPAPVSHSGEDEGNDEGND